MLHVIKNTNATRCARRPVAAGARSINQAPPRSSPLQANKRSSFALTLQKRRLHNDEKKKTEVPPFNHQKFFKAIAENSRLELDNKTVVLMLLGLIAGVFGSSAAAESAENQDGPLSSDDKKLIESLTKIKGFGVDPGETYALLAKADYRIHNPDEFPTWNHPFRSILDSHKNCKYSLGASFLEVALTAKNPRVIRNILEYYLYLNEFYSNKAISSHRQYVPIHKSADELTQKLIQFMKWIDHKHLPIERKTVLESAFEYNDLDVAKILIICESNCYAYNRDGLPILNSAMHTYQRSKPTYNAAGDPSFLRIPRLMIELMIQDWSWTLHRTDRHQLESAVFYNDPIVNRYAERGNVDIVAFLLKHQIAYGSKGLVLDFVCEKLDSCDHTDQGFKKMAEELCRQQYEFVEDWEKRLKTEVEKARAHRSHPKS